MEFDALAAEVVALPKMERLLLGGLYALADAGGQGSADERYLKGRIFPCERRDAGPAAIKKMMESLSRRVDREGRPMIVLDVSHGRAVYSVRGSARQGESDGELRDPAQQVPPSGTTNRTLKSKSGVSTAGFAPPGGWTAAYEAELQRRRLKDARARGGEGKEEAASEEGKKAGGTPPCGTAVPPLAAARPEEPPPSSASPLPKNAPSSEAANEGEAKTSPLPPSPPPGTGSGEGGDSSPKAAVGMQQLRSMVETALGHFSAQDVRDWSMTAMRINWRNGAVAKFQRLVENARKVAELEGRDGGRQYFWGTFKRPFVAEHGTRGAM